MHSLANIFPGTKKQTYHFKILLLFASILLTVFLLEMGLRVYPNWLIYTYITGNQYENKAQIQSQIEQAIQRNDIRGDTFNIYYFGESTMKGEPYVDTIPILIEKMLGGSFDGRMIRWVNFAEEASDFAYSARRMRWVAEHQQITHPSLFIVYSGHNEYLKFTKAWGFTLSGKYGKWLTWLVSHLRIVDTIARVMRYYKLEIDDRSFFDTPLFSIGQYNAIFRQYTGQVGEMVTVLEKNLIPVVFSTLVSNYVDFEPNRSVFCNNESDKTKFKNFMDEGLRAQQADNNAEALSFYTRALAVCDSFAEIYYRMGKAYEMLGDNENAWQAYIKAVDYDRMPIRATSMQNTFLLGLSQRGVVRVADVIDYLRRHADNGLIGYNLMNDGHHPNVKGYLLVAEHIAQTIIEIFANDTKIIYPLSESEATQMLMPTDKEKQDVLLACAQWHVRMATWRYDPENRLAIAEKCLEQFFIINPNNAEGYLAGATIMYLCKDEVRADDYLQRAKQIDTQAVDHYLSNRWYQMIISRSKTK